MYVRRVHDLGAFIGINHGVGGTCLVALVVINAGCLLVHVN